jgi:hypothetical protein
MTLDADQVEQIVGVTDDIKDDPRVAEAVAATKQTAISEADAATAVMEPERIQHMAIEKYGLTLRKPSPMLSALISRVLTMCPLIESQKYDPEGKPMFEPDGKSPVFDETPDCPLEYQPFIWLYALAAPWFDVLNTVDRATRQSRRELLKLLKETCDELKLNGDTRKEILSIAERTATKGMLAFWLRLGSLDLTEDQRSEIRFAGSEAGHAGLNWLMAQIAQWYTDNKLPEDINSDILGAIGEVFALASKMNTQIAQTEAEPGGMEKKTTSPGSSKSLT